MGTALGNRGLALKFPKWGAAHDACVGETSPSWEARSRQRWPCLRFVVLSGKLQVRPSPWGDVNDVDASSGSGMPNSGQTRAHEPLAFDASKPALKLWP
jgi:hypothetical protein